MAVNIENLQPENSGQYIIVDVLPRERFEQVHIPGTVNACVYEITFIDQVKSLSHDPDAKILLYGDSASSHEASFAAEKLARAGYRNLTILQGGLQAWRDARKPLEGSAHPETTSGARTLPDGHYLVDSIQSSVVWAGRNPNGKHWGTLTVEAGELNITAGELAGRFSIDLNSLNNSDLEGNPLKEVLHKHLLSDDFFFAERHRHAVFNLASALPIPTAASTQPNYHLKGDLELRGVSAPLEFTATVNQNANGVWLAEAHFDLDRTRWGIIYGSSRFFAHLGKHLVYDLISLEITLHMIHDRPA